MIGLTGCSAKINPDINPSLIPSKITLQDNSIYSYQQALSQCIIERKVLYKDLLRNAKTQSKLNKKWYQFWK